MTTGRSDYCSVQISNRDGKQEEEEEEQCAVLVRAKTTVRGQGLGFGGRVALMEDGMASPTQTQAREAYSSRLGLA
jgi:hypothetical protein